MILFVKSIEKINWEVVKRHPLMGFKAFTARAKLFCENLILQVFNKFIFPVSFKNSENRDIVIWSNGTIGDNLVKVKAILALKNRYPNCKVKLLINQDSNYHGYLFGNEIFTAFNLVDEIKLIPLLVTKNRKVLKEFYKEYRNSRLLIFPTASSRFMASIKSMLLYWIYGLRCVQGSYLSYNRLYSKEQNLVFSFLPESQRFLRNLPFPVNNYDLTLLFQEQYNKKLEKKLAEKLITMNLEDLNNLLIISFAGKSPMRRYSPIGFSQIIEHWINAFNGKVVLIGASSQFDEAENIIKLVEKEQKKSVYNLSGKISLVETLYLIKLSSILLTMDTGSAHMATLTDTPTLVLYTSDKYNGNWRADGNNIHCLRKELPCSPCYAKEPSVCRYGSPAKCLEAISVQEIWNKISTLNVKK